MLIATCCPKISSESRKDDPAIFVVVGKFVSSECKRGVLSDIVDEEKSLELYRDGDDAESPIICRFLGKIVIGVGLQPQQHPPLL